MAVIRKITLNVEQKHREFQIKYDAKAKEFFIEGFPDYYFTAFQEFKKATCDVEINAGITNKGITIRTRKSEDMLMQEVKLLVKFCNDYAQQTEEYIHVEINCVSSDKSIGGAVSYWQSDKERIEYEYSIVKKVTFGTASKFIGENGHEIHRPENQILIPKTEANEKFCEEFKQAMITLMKKIKDKFTSSEVLLETINNNFKLLS